MIFEAMNYHLKSLLSGKIFKITNDRTKNQEPRAKSQEPRAKNQESRLTAACAGSVIIALFSIFLGCGLEMTRSEESLYSLGGISPRCCSSLTKSETCCEKDMVLRTNPCSVSSSFHWGFFLFIKSSFF
jgi:hypothetical protein